jgi:imidazolonepropionase
VEALGGAWVTPGLIDCHTHLVFGGNRAGEYEQRLQGATYEEIARAGRRIASTVAATRAASEAELVEQARARLAPLMRGGVTTIEIKSATGSTPRMRSRCCAPPARWGTQRRCGFVTTFLALHTVPPEHRGRRDDYMRAMIDGIFPQVIASGLADAVDAYCDEIGFTRSEVEAVFEAAAAAGLPVKLHAEQLSNQHGAALAARFGALSADHLEHLDEAGAAAMAHAGMVGVLLPGAFYALKETRRPPVDLLRAHGVPMAVATDCNPGTSPVLSPTLMLSMACTLFGLTPEEALAGMTVNAARALGLEREIGTIASGKAADLCVWRVSRPAELCYWIGHPGPERRFVGGEER